MTTELYPNHQPREPFEDVVARAARNIKAQQAKFGNFDFARWDNAHSERILDPDAQFVHKSADLAAKQFGYTHDYPKEARWAFIHGAAIVYMKNGGNHIDKPIPSRNKKLPPLK